MVVVIMTGAKEEIRCHCCTAAKPEHGDGGLRWMGDSAKKHNFNKIYNCSFPVSHSQQEGSKSFLLL